MSQYMQAPLFVEPVLKRIVRTKETVQNQNQNIIKLRASYKFLVVRGNKKQTNVSTITILRR